MAGKQSGRVPLMAGNWKMNLNHLEAIACTQKLAFSLNEADLEAVEVAVLPPYTDIRSVQTLIDADKLDLRYGAQDLSTADKGAYTGEVSGSMLAKLGCTYVVVGHSERRQRHDETDEVVNAKVLAAYRNAIVPILCVGEGLEVRQAGEQVEHTLRQLDGALVGITAQQARTIVVAYEPIWAIGTGRTATPQDAQSVCASLRYVLRDIGGADAADAIRVQYGGSVKPGNIADLMAQPDIDGALVGGASLDPEQFAAICRYPATT